MTNATPGSSTTTEPTGMRSAPKWDAAPPPRKPSQPLTRNAPTQRPTPRKTPCSDPSTLQSLSDLHGTLTRNEERTDKAAAQNRNTLFRHRPTTAVDRRKQAMIR